MSAYYSTDDFQFQPPIPQVRGVHYEGSRIKNPTHHSHLSYSNSVINEAEEFDGTSQISLQHIPNQTHEKYFESNAGDGTIGRDHYLSGGRLYSTLLAAFISLFISALDQTIVSTIFETVGNKFDGFDEVSWLTSAFLIPMAVFTPLYGKIAIAFGRKATLISGIVIFELGSLISALANSMGMLIGGRVIQGLGAGCIQVNCSLIVTESVPISFRTISISTIAISYSIASAIGPCIGGVFTSKVSWRWCFYINLPFGGLAILLLVVGYKPPKPTGKLKDRLKAIDYFGSLLLIISLVLLLTGLSIGGHEYSWISPAVLLCIVIGVLFFIVFFMYNFIISKNPMFLKEFFLTPQILCAALTGFFNFAFFLGDVTYLTIYFQVIFKHTALQSGIDLMPLIVSVTLAAVINGIVTKRTRYIKIFYVFSGVCGVVGNGLLLLLNRKSSVGERIGFLIVMGISVGIQVQCTLISCQIKAPNNVTGSLLSVTVFANFCRFFGGAVGVTLASVIFNSKGSSGVKKIIEALPIDVKKQFIDVSAQKFLSSPKLIQKLPKDAREEIYDKLMDAINSSFYLGLAFSCMGLFLCMFATNKRIPKDENILQ